MTHAAQRAVDRPISPPDAEAPSAAAVADAARVRGLARLLDSAVRIPGTDIRIGLDPILGLIPGFGDLAGAALAGWIVTTSARLGAPRPVLARMLLNVAVDAIVGTVPLLGDLFDVSLRANVRNAALLDRHLADPAAARKGSIAVTIGAAAAVIVLVTGIIALAALVVRAVLGLAT